MSAITMMKSAIAQKDRVRANTRPEINEKIDKEMERRIKFFAAQDKETISERIAELDREWDIERSLETNAAVAALTGMVLGAFVSRRWYLMPAVVAGFLLQHAIQGWCPPVPLFRKMRVRTRTEIEQERYALKALRGDFQEGESRDPMQVIRSVST
jgi:hypothetical protein